MQELRRKNRFYAINGALNLSDTEKISNAEIKNFIEHSLKLIISGFNDRLEKIESRLSDIEVKLGSSDTRDTSLPLEAKEKSKKEADNDLSDALKLIGSE